MRISTPTSSSSVFLTPRGMSASLQTSINDFSVTIVSPVKAIGSGEKPSTTRHLEASKWTTTQQVAKAATAAEITQQNTSTPTASLRQRQSKRHYLPANPGNFWDDCQNPFEFDRLGGFAVSLNFLSGNH